MVTSIYASLFVFLYIYLSFYTIRARLKHQVAVGDGEKPELLRAIRVHGNFNEYAPLALILIFMLEMQNIPAWAIHILCCMLLLGRVLHASGVKKVKENLRWRQSGMVLTFLCLLSSGATHLLLGLKVL